MSDSDAFFQSKELIPWVVRAVFLTLVVMIFVSMLNSYFSRDLDVSDLENHILSERLFYDDCFVLGDTPGTVDLNKFNSERVNDCMSGGNVGIRLMLKFGNEIREIEINEEKLSLLPFCTDEDNFKCYSKSKYVLVGDELISGRIDMEMVKRVQ